MKISFRAFHLICMGLVILAPMSFASDIQVLAVVGTATVEGKKLKSGDVIKVNEVIQTEENSGVKIRLGDRTVIDIAANSVFRVESVRGGTKESSVTNLEKGAAKASVPSNSAVKASVIKSLQQKPKFYMKTKWSVIAVRGTKFYAYSTDNGIYTMGVREGRCAVYSANGRELIKDVGAGFSLMANDGNPATWKLLPVPPENRSGELDNASVIDGIEADASAIPTGRVLAGLPVVNGAQLASAGGFSTQSVPKGAVSSADAGANANNRVVVTLTP